MTMTASSAPTPSLPILFRDGWRVFFMAAGLYAVAAIAVWLLWTTGAAELPFAPGPIAWHAHEMVFGFASAALGGFAGVLVAPVLFVSVHMGALISLKAFAANIIGGFGSIPGAILGGLALGVVETFGAAYISVPYKDAIAFAVLLLFLLVRPQGLFGERIAEKA